MILLDDPTKDRKEADSPTIREQLWSWYTQVLQTRLMTKEGRIVIIQTRWHEDDLIGRLTDPTNPCYSVSEAKKWRVIDMPAIAREKDVLGRKVGEALWPERFDRDYLDSLRETDIRGFQALYQGRPTPEEGSFFKAVSLRTYAKMRDMPAKERLRYYGASDHAVSLEQGRDKTCLMVIGVDDHDEIWVQPDLFWQQADTATVVETMVQMMDKLQASILVGRKRAHFEEHRPLPAQANAGEAGLLLHRRNHAHRRQADTRPIDAGAHDDGQNSFPGFHPLVAGSPRPNAQVPAGRARRLRRYALALWFWPVSSARPAASPKESKTPKMLTYGWVIEEAQRERKKERSHMTVGGW